LHDDNDGRSGCDWRNRVHSDAKLAMIGVALAGVQVRNLSDGKRGQKDETEDCDGRQEAGPDAISGAGFAAENCRKSCQSMQPSTQPFGAMACWRGNDPALILQNLTEGSQKFGRFRCGQVVPKLHFGGFAPEKTATGRERLN
jgi:hypothetical protein